MDTTAQTGPLDANGAVPIAATIDRLLVLLREENQVLAAQEVRPHLPYAERKNQLLRDLMTFGRRSSALASQGDLACRIRTLKEELALNEDLLGSHIRALAEISSIIVDCIKMSESDGTYAFESAIRRRPRC